MRGRVLAAAAALLLAACAPVSPAAAPVAEGDEARVANAIAEAKSAEARGDLRGAEEAWERILAARPGHASALYSTARLRRSRGDPGGALERCRDLARVEPLAGRGRLLAAEILSDPASGPLRDLEAGEREAEAARERNPEESGPYLALGRVHLLQGRSGPAERRLATAAVMNPRDAESRSLLGVLRLRAGRTGEAREAFLGALAAGAPAPPGGVAGEGDTRASLAADRPPSAGELRASAGLAVLGTIVGGARDGGPCPEALRAGAERALSSRGTGEALLDRDGDGRADAAAVERPGGGAACAAAEGNAAVVYR